MMPDMQNNGFTWIPFYQEFADKLLSYRDKSAEVLDKLGRALAAAKAPGKLVQPKRMVHEIDPFTVFAFFNRRIKDAHRVRLAQELKKEFGIAAEVPQDFDGIPVAFPESTWFFRADANGEDAGDVAGLWNVFSAALAFAERHDSQEARVAFATAFDQAEKQKQVCWNLTMGLFWIRPYAFLNLDKTNRPFLVGEKFLAEAEKPDCLRKDTKPPSARDYLALIDSCRRHFAEPNCPFKNFPELSHAAWLATRQTAVPSVNPQPVKSEVKNMTHSWNTILYGPPGTGKTFRTISDAVAIIEEKPCAMVEDEAEKDFAAVCARYNDYKKKGAIAFTTFHQSYGYEDFIEGIRPVLDDDNEDTISYEVRAGVFKQFCEDAGRPIAAANQPDFGIGPSPTIWKVSLGGTGENPIRDDCMKNGRIRIAWNEYGPDISKVTNFDHGGEVILNAFYNGMQAGDLVLSCFSARTIDAVGVVVDADPEWHDEFQNYKRARRVNWLVKGPKRDIIEMNGGRQMTLSTVYRLKAMTFANVMTILKEADPKKFEPDQSIKSRVFIIDEINRGDVSKIFGELITLIEPEKRQGAAEAMSVTLPVSRTQFSVPQNVYILGTMNTADRSIEALDSALRRRFAFVEMMPNLDRVPEVVEGVELRRVLAGINDRVEFLLDRDHKIGHSYFMRCASLADLRRQFHDQVISLLQEYFYGDLGKVHLVLGDRFVAGAEKDPAKVLFDADDQDFENKSFWRVTKEKDWDAAAFVSLYPKAD